MDNKHVEDKLRNTLQVKLPPGMRDRILRQARQSRTDRPIFGMSRWKAAFVALSLMIIAFTGISEHGRGERIAALTGGSNSSVSDRNFLRMRLGTGNMLARIPEDCSSHNDRSGGNLQ